MILPEKALSVLTASFILLSISLTYAGEKTTQHKTAVTVTRETAVVAVKAGETKAETNKDTDTSGDKKDKKKEETTEEKETREADRIKQVLKYGLQKERQRAIGRVMVIKTESIKKDLIAVLVDLIKDEPDAEVKQKAITTLGELKAESAVTNILKNVSDPFEDVRIAAVYALQSIKAVSTGGALLEELKKQDLTKDSNFSEALIRTLGEFGTSEIVPLAKKAIEDTRTTKNHREILVLTLGNIKGGGQEELLLKIFKDEEEDLTVRAYAVNSMSKLNMKSSIEDIKKVLNEIEGYPFKKKQRYYTLYIYSVTALARLGDPAAIPRLENALRSNSANVRVKAANLMKELKDKRTIDILKYKMEYDPSSAVRKAAREALKEMGVEVKEEKEPQKEEEKEETE